MNERSNQQNKNNLSQLLKKFEEEEEKNREREREN